MRKLILGGLSILLVSAAVSPALKAEMLSHPSTSLETLSMKKMAGSMLKSGMFVNGEHPTAGNAVIVEENGDRYLEFDQSFQTDSGPDLFVVLHRSADVIGSGQAPAFGIKEGEYVTLAPLETTTGKQRYAIPENINLEDYNSVAIWCRRFNATFGAASLDS
ncbi:MAG: DM13 domain-containing protein [Spirulinaceae cyanobacterium]